MSSKPVVLSAGSPVADIKGFGPKKVSALAKLGIRTIRDAVDCYPRAYEDLRNVKNIAEIQNEEKCLVKAYVLLVQPGRGYGRKRSLRLLVEDSTGRMEVIFFSAGFMAKSFERGSEYRFFGKTKVENGRITMFHPSFAKADGSEESGILPVYPLASGLTQKDLRMLTRMSLELTANDPETLPAEVIGSAKLCGNHYALSNLHFPEGETEYSESRYRLVYEELFDLRSAILLSRSRFGSGRNGIRISSGGGNDFAEKLGYTLTGAQQRCILEILSDMDSDTAMNRLVQGDVGCGKTAVAEVAIMEAVKAGFQAAFMAPTELLARQHFDTLSGDFAPFGVHVELLTGSMSAAERNQALKRIQNGDANVIVGTHAILSERVEFSRLGLVITDEQHRFGVNQRQLLTEKGDHPDVLVMTATPIPRTLAVVLYGDLDISLIDELPPGRQSVQTRHFPEAQREDAYQVLLDEVRKGHQAYVVATFIDESEALEGRSAEELFAEFLASYPEIPCALLHGGMKQTEKDAIMQEFHDGNISVLIATVVIEVGINVPNATVMLIENAERFGLAQLHQLRGRVGRGSERSYCLLLSGEENDVSKVRCDIMCQTQNGFEIAEKDLELRGPGEIFGYRQHGLPQLRIADPVKHRKIAELAGADAAKLLADDPGLERPENALFADRIRTKYLKTESLTL